MKDQPLLLVARRSALLLALALFSGLGCSTSAKVKIHPKYSEVRPTSIHVLPVKNATLRQDLHEYRPDSRLQQLATGGRKVDILEVFRTEVQKAIQNRGYTLRDDSVDVGVGTMEIVIEEWRSGPEFGASEIVVRYRLELALLQSGESLFSTTITYRTESRGSAQRKMTPTELEREIGKTVRKALDVLPFLDGSY